MCLAVTKRVVKNAEIEVMNKNNVFNYQTKNSLRLIFVTSPIMERVCDEEQRFKDEIASLSATLKVDLLVVLAYSCNWFKYSK